MYPGVKAMYYLLQVSNSGVTDINPIGREICCSKCMLIFSTVSLNFSDPKTEDLHVDISMERDTCIHVTQYFFNMYLGITFFTLFGLDVVY